MSAIDPEEVCAFYLFHTRSLINFSSQKDFSINKKIIVNVGKNANFKKIESKGGDDGVS